MGRVRKFITRLLRLQEIFVIDYTFGVRERALHLWVRPHKSGCRCPHCDRRGPIVRISPEPRMWRDLPVAGWTVCFWYQPKEIRCPTHGRVQEVIPWAAPYARITYRLEYLLLRYSQVMTQQAAADLLHLPPSTLSDLLHQSITRLRAGHAIRGLRAVGIDEIGYCKGHKYATLVYDLARARVVWVGAGKGRETIDRFFREALSPYQRAQIREASCDMSEAYLGALQHHCPQAALVLDRFHVVKALNGALDEVRKEQWREAAPADRKALKGLRWLLFKHSAHRSKRDTRLLHALRTGNRRIYRAWVLKDEFEQFWTYRSPAAAEKFFRRWTTAALRSRLAPLRKLVGTFRKHQAELLAFITTPLTNAVAEGLNRLIKIVKNRASGFRTLAAFTDLIYLTVGDLDLPAQIPVRFRAI